MPSNLREPDEKWRRQRAFRERVSEERVRSSFKSPDDLAQRVVQAIRNWEQENNLVQAELTDTRTSGRYIIHPYPLERNFSGRFAERTEISEWWLEGSEPILAIVGIGGVGKSAMVWSWLQHDLRGQRLLGSSPELYTHKQETSDIVRGRPPRIEHDQGLISGAEAAIDESDALVNVPVLWWSFYEREADFDSFLEWFIRDVLQEKPSDLPATSERVERVLQQLIQSRCLLVLDGFEHELLAYGQRRQQHCDETLIHQGLPDRRQCIRPEAGVLLQRLAASRSASRVIITSQLLPSELEGLDRKPLPGCRTLPLTGLDPGEALLFMRAQGVKGSDPKIEEFCEAFDYHPLSLRVISGRIIHDLQHPGDVGAIPINVATGTIAEEYRGISVVYNEASLALRTFLDHMSVLDLPVSPRELQELAGENELANLVQTATDLGLVIRDLRANEFSMHPIVKACIRNKLTQE
jgi:hypothetical protein